MKDNTITLKNGNQYSFVCLFYPKGVCLYNHTTGDNLYLTIKQYTEQWVKGVLNPGKINHK